MVTPENTNLPPPEEGPLDPFASPDKRAKLAYDELMESVRLYQEGHPSVSPEDLEIIRWKFQKSIEERDQDNP